jgi:hypothetical protein
MATFNVGVGKDDIQEAILLPEDWYKMEIFKEPTEAKNRAWTDVGESLTLEAAKNINEKAAKNIVIHLKVISDVPEHNGRMLTKWLPLPNQFDEGQYTNRGQHVPDSKAEVIFKWAEAFGGTIEGSEASLSIGQKAYVYVIQDEDLEGEPVNAISMNVNPRSLESGTEGLAVEGDPFADVDDEAKGGLL